MEKPTTTAIVNEDYEAYRSFFDDADAPSDSFKESISYFKSKIDNLNAASDDIMVDSIMKYIGQDCPISVIKRVKSILDGRLYELEHVIIPNLLASEGVSSMDFSDGSKVSIEMSYESKTLDKAKAISWLEESGHGDAVRDTLDFLPGSFDDKAMDFLKNSGYSFTIDRTVNGQTLKKIVKEVLSSGGKLPPEDAIRFRAEKVAVFKYQKGGF